MTDELDEILNIHTIDAGNRVLKLIDVNEAKQAIQALIDQECTKARIEAFDVAFDCHDYDRLREYRAELLKEVK